MDQQEVRAFVETFFHLRECKFLENNKDYITVELNADTDRDLGYRPFYWTFVDKMGIEPQLLTQTFIFSSPAPPDIKGETIQIGSNRLHQIFAATKKRGRFVRLYEDQLLHQGTNSLDPWLLMNYKIEYVCDQKKERLFSVGIHLVTGELRQNFYQTIQHIPLTPKLPAYVFVKPAVYSIPSALQKIESALTLLLRQEDTTWADRAEEKYRQEEKQTLRYYDEIREQFDNQKKYGKNAMEAIQKWETERNQRLEELAWQYKPRIEVKTINQGLIYLRTHPDEVSNNVSPPALYNLRK